MHAEIAHDLLDAVVGEIAVAAEQLQRVVRHLEGGVGDEPLGHGAVLAWRPARLPVELPGRLVEEDPRRLQLGLHVGEPELQRLEAVQRVPEGAALGGVGERPVERRLRAAERARRRC